MNYITRNSEPLKYFNSMLLKDTDDCIIWPYAKTYNGYGVVSYNGKSMRVHRLALLLTIDSHLSDKIFALHRPIICRNRNCFNPRHLYWGTSKDNMNDKIADGTTNRGKRCGNSKLTDIQVIAIRNDKRRNVDISKEYDVSPVTIGCIKNGKTWFNLIETNNETTNL